MKPRHEFRDSKQELLAAEIEPEKACCKRWPLDGHWMATDLDCCSSFCHSTNEFDAPSLFRRMKQEDYSNGPGHRRRVS